MFEKHKNNLKNNFNDIKDSSVEYYNKTTKMFKEFSKLPWKDLPVSGWIYFIIITIIFIVAFTVVLPLTIGI